MKTATALLATLILGTAAQAQIVFDTKLVIIKAKPDDETVVAEFPFTVKGDRPVTILEYESACSCLSAEISKDGKLTWKPGEKGVVKGHFKIAARFKGVVDKQIILRMREQRLPEKLTVRVDIPTLVNVDPQSLFWNVGGPPEPRSFKVKISEGAGIKITKVETTNEQFQFELKEVANGDYEIVITPKDMKGPQFGLLRIRTDSEFTRHQSYQVFMVVRRPKGSRALPAQGGGRIRPRVGR